MITEFKMLLKTATLVAATPQSAPTAENVDDEDRPAASTTTPATPEVGAGGKKKKSAAKKKAKTVSTATPATPEVISGGKKKKTKAASTATPATPEGQKKKKLKRVNKVAFIAAMASVTHAGASSKAADEVQRHARTRYTHGMHPPTSCTRSYRPAICSAATR